MEPAIFAKPVDLIGKEGTKLGPTEWLAIEQDRVNGFAEVTGDHQWIHVDPERAKDGPFGTTIAHGFLTLSLLPAFFATAFKIQNVRMGVNYGLNKVRFTAPVPVGGGDSGGVAGAVRSAAAATSVNVSVVEAP